MDEVLISVGEALDALQEIHNFYACYELQLADVNIELKDVGRLTFPLSNATIEHLISISSKSKYGLREQTLLDENVRNSQELKPDQFNVTINDYSMTQMLRKMQNELNLPENSVLIPHLHNMLIYGPGQFFDMHQDTEKLENMIATMVVVLPSPHIGGNLVIIHNNYRDFSFSTENFSTRTLKCIAFYSDCMHKVEKIKEGYRVALTYNLVIQSGTQSDVGNANEKLESAVNEYFEAKKVKRRREILIPKLVYLLNHNYSEHGLSWDMLKGDDRVKTSALKQVAKELGLVSHLALAKIEQVFIEEHSDSDNCDEEIFTLSYWIDEENKKLPFSELNIEANEVCLTKKTKDFDPYLKYVTAGRMGNEGGAEEFWYRRAAIVLWPESCQISMTFDLSYDNALNDLFMLTNAPGNEEKVLNIINSAGHFLFCDDTKFDKNDFDKFVNIAFYAADKSAATSVLSRFERILFNFNISESLVKLQTQYGFEWCIELLKKWRVHKRLTNIDTFVNSFLQHGGMEQIAEYLLDVQSENLIRYYSHMSRTPLNLKNSLSERIKMLYELFIACSTIKDVGILDKIFEHIMQQTDLYPILSLAELFLKLQKEVDPSKIITYYGTLKSYLIQAIDNKLTLPVRDANDWSIDTQLTCDCKYCSIASCFVRSKTEIKKVWPMSRDLRWHIKCGFESLCLPVAVIDEETGSPTNEVQMVLVKNESLHKDAQKMYNDLKLFHEKLNM